MRTLFENGTFPNPSDNHGKTPCSFGAPVCLLANGGDLGAADSQKSSHPSHHPSDAPAKPEHKSKNNTETTKLPQAADTKQQIEPTEAASGMADKHQIQQGDMDTAAPPQVHVTLVLNRNQSLQKLSQVSHRANIPELWTLAKKKLNVKGVKKLQLADGPGQIYLARTQQPLRMGDLLQNEDRLVFSLGEPVAFSSALIQVKPPRLPETSPDYLLVLDFEATCNNKGPAPQPQEIIEFPTLALHVATGQVERNEFHEYILPDVHPQLSSFCTELTGITQARVNTRGISLREALDRHAAWRESLGLVPLSAEQEEEDAKVAADATEEANETKKSEKDDDGSNDDHHERNQSTFLFLTCGDWDLGTCLPKQLDYHGKKVPQETGMHQWINVKHEFYRHYGKKAGGMAGMLRHCGLELEGRHHSGIDDCRNIARISQQMLQEGWQPAATTSLLRR